VSFERLDVVSVLDSLGSNPNSHHDVPVCFLNSEIIDHQTMRKNGEMGSNVPRSGDSNYKWRVDRSMSIYRLNQDVQGERQFFRRDQSFHFNT
jgi:hypothetical protein